jgi:hypothetical protein
MDQQQYPEGSPEPLTGTVVPQGAPAARVEPIGETWASGVGPVRLGSGTSRFRWAIALGVVLCVALVTAGGAFVLSGAGGAAKSLTAGNAPKDTVVFVDLRMDLPGDQHENLADFLTHFPGFADRAQFDNAYDEILNEITSAISPDLTYTSAFQSWTSGELSLAVTSLGTYSMPDLSQNLGALPTDAAGLAALSSATTTPPSGALIVALKDRSAGEAWVSSEVARTGVAFSSQSYAGTTLYVAQTATDGLTAAYAFTDKVLVAGDVTAVKAALDAPAKGSLADSANYQMAMRSLSGDSIATFYADPAALFQQEMSAISGIAGMTGMNLSTANIPAWMVGSARAESDHMTIELTMPKTKGSLSPGNEVSVLASDLPGSTVAVMEIHSVGQLVDDELAALAATPSSASLTGGIKQIQDALSQIGGVDWVGDADMVLTKNGSSYGGGLVVKTPDSTTATAKKAMITSLVALASLGGSGITQANEAYKGTTITIISVAGSDATPALSFALAAKGDLLVAGYGDPFVKAVLDTTSANSLAAQSDYQAVMAAVGASNSEYGYFDISAVADQIGQAFFPADPGYYNLNYKPYMDHVGGAAFASIDGSTVTLRFVFTAK